MTIVGVLADPSTLRDPVGALDEHGRVRVLPAAFWEPYNIEERAWFATRAGIYCIPTVELVTWLRERVGKHDALEIGSGCGVLAEALGIRATDSKLQEDSSIAAYYAALGQPTIAYGPQVKTFDAWTAVKTFQPRVVVAAWVTHRFTEAQRWRGGNMFGVNFGPIVDVCDLIFVGNLGTHAKSPIMEWEHETYTPPWLVSRASNGADDFIGVWKRGCSRGAPGRRTKRRGKGGK